MGDPFLNYFALLVLFFVVAALLYGITAHRNQGQRLVPVRGGFRTISTQRNPRLEVQYD